MDSHYIILLDWLTNNKFNDNWSNTDNKVSIDGEWKKARAAALFDALDADGSGEIDDEEFIEGWLFPNNSFTAIRGLLIF